MEEVACRLLRGRLRPERAARVFPRVFRGAGARGKARGCYGQVVPSGAALRPTCCLWRGWRPGRQPPQIRPDREANTSIISIIGPLHLVPWEQGAVDTYLPVGEGKDAKRRPNSINGVFVQARRTCAWAPPQQSIKDTVGSRFRYESDVDNIYIYIYRYTCTYTKA